MKDFKSEARRKEFESFVKNHIDHILKCGNLSHYYMRSLFAQKMRHGFTIAPNPSYLEFSLNYNAKYASQEFESGDMDDLIRTLCHEVSHILTSEIEVIPKLKKMSDRFDPMFERFTEHASRWLYELYTTKYVPAHGIDLNTGKKKK